MMKIIRFLIYILFTSIPIQAKEIAYESYRVSCRLIENAPISLQKAYLIANETLAQNQRFNDRNIFFIRVNAQDVSVIGTEYFFHIKHFYKPNRKEQGIYVSSVNGQARLVYDIDDIMVDPFLSSLLLRIDVNVF